MSESEGISESVAREVPELLEILREMKEKTAAVNQHVVVLKEHVESEEFDTEKGVSLLELKAHQMLSYLINLTQVMLAKTQGESIKDSPAINRLVEIRTVLEKIRPLDQRLRYQVDKLIRVAATGAAGAQNDPLRFRPNPNQLVSKLEEQEEEEGSGEEERQPKAYVPPRVVAMPYEEDDGGRKARREARMRQQALQSSVVRDLQEEFLDTPVEIRDGGPGTRRRREVETEKEQERFEEEYFVRLPHKRHSRDSGHGARETTEELTDFSALRGLTGGEGGLPARKKRHPTSKSHRRKGRKVH